MSAGDVYVRIMGNTSGLDNALTKSQQKLKDFSDSAMRIGGFLSLTVTAPLLALGKAAVQSSADIEMLEASFTTMLGSATSAKTMMNEIIDMAAHTPFIAKDLAAGAKMLLQYGVAADDIIPTLRTLGDVSVGNSEIFNRLVYVYGQTKAAGRLFGQDLRQMTEAGFNPLYVISQKTGESMLSLTDRMREGKVSAAEVAQAFKWATEEGGKFFGGMERGSKTLIGLTSTLKDNVAILGRSFADEYIPGIKGAIKGLSELALTLSKMPAPMKDTIVALGTFLTLLGPGILAIGLATRAVIMFKAAMALPAGPIVLGIAAISAVVFVLYNNLKRAREEKEALDRIMKGGIGAGTTATEDYITLKNELKRLENSKPLENVNLGAYSALKPNNGADIEKRIEQLKLLTTNYELMEKGRSAGAAQAAADAKKEEIRLSNMTQEQIIKEKRLAKVISDRLSAEAEYEAKKLRNDQQYAVGLINREKMESNLVDITRTYAEVLVDLGYNLDTIGTKAESIGDKALKSALNVLNVKDDPRVISDTSFQGMLSEVEFKKRQQEDYNAYLVRLVKERVDKQISDEKVADEIRFESMKNFKNMAQILSEGLTKEEKEELDKQNKDVEKALTDREKLYLSNANKIISIMSTVATTVSELLTDSNADIGRSLAKLTADIAVLFGPYGQIASGVINLGLIIYDTFNAVEKKRKEKIKKEIAAEKEKIKKEIAAEKEKTEKLIELAEQERDAKIDLLDVETKAIDYKIANEERWLDAKLAIIDEAERRELASLGLLDKTKSESLQDDLNNLAEEWNATTDINEKKAIEERAWDLIKEIAKTQILEKYQDERDKIIKESNDRQIQWEYEKAVIEKQIAVQQASIDFMKAKADAGFQYAEANPMLSKAKYKEEIGWDAMSDSQKKEYDINGMYQVYIDGYYARMAAHVASVTEPLLNLFNLYSDMPLPMLPGELDQLVTDALGTAGTGTGTGGEGMMTTILVNLDSIPILEAIGLASNNGTLILNANAVVAQ